jgi:hypothetical protein
MSRNTVAHTVIYGLYFLFISMNFLARSLGANPQWQNVLLSGSTLACLAAWGVFLTRRGERKVVSIGHKWTPEQQQRLMAQLAAINASLQRSVPK